MKKDDIIVEYFVLRDKRNGKYVSHGNLMGRRLKGTVATLSGTKIKATAKFASKTSAKYWKVGFAKYLEVVKITTVVVDEEIIE